MRVVLMSDTHGHQVEVPEGDLLIHSGDFTIYGRRLEIIKFGNWMRGLPHRYKVVVAGNHDIMFEKDPSAARMYLGPMGRDKLIYLQDSGVEIEGLHLWGSPWTPRFYDWAFNLGRGEALRRKWGFIPDDTDILVTHGPPFGILDLTSAYKTRPGEHVGCEELLKVVSQIKPKLHTFGHIHPSYGVLEKGGTTYINACICDSLYDPVNKPVVVDL